MAAKTTAKTKSVATEVEKPAEPKCEPACADGKECKCENDKCECVDSVKPTECTCDSVYENRRQYYRRY